ncbi:hypothetical protein SAMN04489806_0065 [Paramicrobacterium humi]|uniref:Uncharacterized protein n=1 Tax=Paramicrobacterium humi TaxID=640635 RepID=A0A1H4IP13_9MICO|nr:hypothetical protein SAMN04489806_0065 [Microbacterium humi]
MTSIWLLTDSGVPLSTGRLTAAFPLDAFAIPVIMG